MDRSEIISLACRMVCSLRDGARRALSYLRHALGLEIEAAVRALCGDLGGMRS